MKNKCVVDPKNPFISNKYKLIERVEITPELAQYLLDKYCEVNPVDPKYGNFMTIVDSIKNGRWIEESGSCITFTKDGQNLDGRHRLIAIVKAGMAVFTSVAVGVEANPFSGFTTRLRTYGEQMAVEMGLSKEEAPRITKVIKIAATWMRNTNEKRERWDFVTKWEFYLEHKEAIEFAMATGLNNKARSAGVRAACAMYYEKNATKAKEFFGQLVKPRDEYIENCAVRLLRESLEFRTFGGNNRANDDDYTRTVSAIHVHYYDLDVKRLPSSRNWGF